MKVIRVSWDHAQGLAAQAQSLAAHQSAKAALAQVRGDLSTLRAEGGKVYRVLGIAERTFLCPTADEQWLVCLGGYSCSRPSHLPWQEV